MSSDFHDDANLTPTDRQCRHVSCRPYSPLLRTNACFNWRDKKFAHSVKYYSILRPWFILVTILNSYVRNIQTYIYEVTSLRKAGDHLQDHIVSQPRRPQSTLSSDLRFIYAFKYRKYAVITELGEIWGSHNGAYEKDNILGCCLAQQDKGIVMEEVYIF
jgi:hypothetical protein